MFARLFKGHAEFDQVMDRNKQNAHVTIAFIQNLVSSERLKPVQPDGITGGDLALDNLIQSVIILLKSYHLFRKLRLWHKPLKLNR